MANIQKQGKMVWLKQLRSNIGYLLKETFHEFVADHGVKLSASLSYYAVFSLPPLLIVIISLCGYFFGADAVRGEIFGKINGFVGNDAALQIQEVIKNVRPSGTNTFVTIIGIIVLVVSASGVFAEMQDSINFIWRLKAKPKRGFYKFVKNRLMSFSMIGSLGILLILGLVFNSIMDVLSERLTARYPDNSFSFFYMLNLLLVFVNTTILFTIIFKILPDGKINLWDCLVGGTFTAVLFIIGKFAIGAYLGSAAIVSVYGAAGSVILILVWVYYSAIILYFGAEFTKVFAHTHGKKIIPNAYAFLVNK